MACTVHRPVGLEGADRSAAPTTLEPQDNVRGSWFERRLREPSFVITEIADCRRQRVRAAEREGASEVVSVEPSLPDLLFEHHPIRSHIKFTRFLPVVFS